MSSAIIKQKSPVLDTVRGVLGNRFFPFATATLVTACYYSGLDMVSLYYLVFVAAAMAFLLDDLTPLVPHLAFLNIFVSMQNCPLNFGEMVGSDFYTRTGNLVQIVILIFVLAGSMITRLVFTLKEKGFKPDLTFWGLVAVAALFLLNGVGSKAYVISDTLYGALLAFLFLGVFVLISNTVKLTDENYMNLVWGFIAFSAVLVLELGVLYAERHDVIIVGGHIIKQQVILGWGVWNSIGTLFCICIPPVCLAAAKSKYGYAFLLYAALLTACAFLTGSRQAMLGSTFAFGACSIALIVKSRTRIINAIIIGAIALVAIIVVAVKWDKVLSSIEYILNGIFNDDGSYSGGGRHRLMMLAINYFKADPVFGGGFFIGFESFELTGITGTLLPTFAHCTIFELLATCGILGLIAYVGHRVTTVIAFAKKPTLNKFYMATCIATLLLICLFDNYIFYLLPTLIYSSVLPFATGKPEPETLTRAKIKF